MNDTFLIQICYATPNQQILMPLTVEPSTTIQEALTQSGILQQFPEMDLKTQRVGIYGKLKTMDTIVQEHDRIEIYRALIVDPMTARKRRAFKNVS